MKKVVRLTESELTQIIGRIIKESKELKEIGGISTDARSWSEIITSEVKNSYGRDFTINGKDFPDAYEKFPVDKFDVKFLPIGAFGYDQDNSGFVGDEYIVTLVIDPRIIYQVGPAVINHEMKHAYQDFKRYSNKSVGIKDSKFIKSMYTKDFERIIVSVMQGQGTNDTLYKILYLYYILSGVEQDAYLENIYDEISGKPGNYGTQVLMGVRMLDRLNFSNLDEKTWEKLKQMDIPFIKKFRTKEEFANYSKRYLTKLSDKFKRKINKMTYLNFTNPEQEKTETQPERKRPIKQEKSNNIEKESNRKLSDQDLEKLKNDFNNRNNNKTSDDESPFVGGHSWEDIKNAFKNLKK